MVESSLVILLFFMLLLGVMECSRALHAYHFLSNVAREAARYSIVRGGDSGRAVDSTAVANYVTSRAYGMNPADFIVVTNWDPDNQPGSRVSVDVQYNYQSVLPFIPPVTMASSSEMTIQY